MRLFLLAVAGAALVAGPSSAADGEHMFLQSCAACHKPTGLGVPGAFPALAGDKFVVGDPKAPIGRVLNGRGGMPSFANDLSDADVATILTYVRGAWGNKAKPVTAAMVTALRTGGNRENAKASLQAH
jgi:cytochrome c6